MTAVPKSGRKKGFPTRPLLKIDIEMAQRNSKSGLGAARWLKVHYATYKKWAVYYGLFEGHKNERGVGISKPKNYTEYSLERIFAGHLPNYSRKKLKDRLIKTGLMQEKCAICGFSEKRIIDNRCPLTVVTIDDSKPQFALDNIHLLCYNCNFLTNVSIHIPDTRPKVIEKDIKQQLDMTDEELETLSHEAIQEAIAEARQELRDDNTI